MKGWVGRTTFRVAWDIVDASGKKVSYHEKSGLKIEKRAGEQLLPSPLW
jgi:hypothetical protein